MKKLKKLINQILDATENLIYSVKYLPQILYFGSLGIILYEIIIEEFIPDSLLIPFGIFFLYITVLAIKNYGTKREFGGKNKS
jgi:hypothetical protein